MATQVKLFLEKQWLLNYNVESILIQNLKSKSNYLAAWTDLFFFFPLRFHGFILTSFSGCWHHKLTYSCFHYHFNAVVFPRSSVRLLLPLLWRLLQLIKRERTTSILLEINQHVMLQRNAYDISIIASQCHAFKPPQHTSRPWLKRGKIIAVNKETPSWIATVMLLSRFPFSLFATSVIAAALKCAWI